MYIVLFVFVNTSLRGVSEPDSPITSKYLQKADEDEKGKSETWMPPTAVKNRENAAELPLNPNRENLPAHVTGY